MKIGVLTSSRADFGIYRPLLQNWQEETEISFDIIAFGQHLMESFGNTLDEIEGEGFDVKHRISSEYIDDSPHGIALNYASTLAEFASFWASKKYDWVLALGDRYEMSAAVQAGIPYQVRFAHIHAGEKTLGAIDEIYRHQITLASTLHFVSLSKYATRVHEIVGDDTSTCVTGAIGLENLSKINLLSHAEFYQKWGVDMTIPTLFFIIHPETKNYADNYQHVKVLEELSLTLSENFQLIVSLPNSDTNGSMYREMWNKVNTVNPKIKLIEHFGSQSFFSCMKLSKLIIGNSSSAIIEAASFNKFVLNLGTRQFGRETGDNVIHLPYDKSAIFTCVMKFVNQEFQGKNIYEKQNGVQLITEKLKQAKV